MNNYFDHILGEQDPKLDLEAQEAVKNYILNHSENQSEDVKMETMKFGLQIEMVEYLNRKEKGKFIPTGEFLNRLLGIYKISKKRFAEYIELERTNLQAILKGDRKFNSLLANKVEQIFQIPTMLWLQIETKNDLSKFYKSKKYKSKYSLKKLRYESKS